MKKLKLLFHFSLFIFSSSFCSGQITYTQIPLDSALVARDLHTNLGTLTVAGFADTITTRYDSVCLKIYRDSILIDSLYQPLTYTRDTALFSFSFQIPAELHEYMVSVYGIDSGAQTIDTTINALLAGDVYVIDGQSNALAEMRDSGSANMNKSEFIRVFGNSDSATAGLMANLKWFRGEGDGGFLENGHAGQWGLHLGKLIVDSIKIPVAIFNNGCGGTPISYYERLSNYKTNPNSNYARLYFRLTKTGLQNNVRAILWSQGETDALDATSTARYVTEFDTLEHSFMQDFPGFQKTYIFQTRNGCTATITNLMKIKEAQRQVTVQRDTAIEIMSTSALREDSGDCHFDYHGGYEIWGNRIYNVMARDLYGIAPTREIDAPMITAAYMSDSTTLVVVENADSLIRHHATDSIQNYEIENAGPAVIDTIYLNKNKIIFKLSAYPGTSATVSYLAQYKDSANWLTNTNDIEVVCFYKYPVADSIPFVSTGIASYKAPSIKVYPNPAHNYAYISLSMNGEYFLEVDDITGRKMLPEPGGQLIEFSGDHYLLPTQGLTPGLYFIRVFNNENTVIGTTKIMVQ